MPPRRTTADRSGQPPQPLDLDPVEAPSAVRRGWLVAGVAVAAAASAAVFLTDNPLLLRVALLAVCWAFVGAAFLAGNRRADQAAAAGREAELRHAYELELEREVAARHEYEVQLESRLRREAEAAMRTELAQLRGELAGLGSLQEDLASVGRLRADLAGLGELRTQLAALGELRGEIAGLGQLRAEIAGLGELRSDLGRMRTELTEVLSGELLVERMVMRAQSVRGPAQPGPAATDGRTLEGTTGWDVDLSEDVVVVPAEPVEAVDAPRPVPSPPPVPPPAVRPVTPVAEQPPVQQRPPSPLEWLIGESVVEPPAEPQPPSPLEWLGDRALLDADGNPTGEVPVVPAASPEPHREPAAAVQPPRRRHRRAAEPDEDDGRPAWSAPAIDPAPAPVSSSYDGAAYDALLFGTSVPSSAGDRSTGWSTGSSEPAAHLGTSYSHEPSAYEPMPAESPSWSTGSTSWSAEPKPEPADPPAPRAEEPAPPRPEASASGHARLEQILAESGVEAPSGGRSRRRRYRDEDGESAGDDVLARVLGRS